MPEPWGAMPISRQLGLALMSITLELAINPLIVSEAATIHGLQYRFHDATGRVFWAPPVDSCRDPAHDLVMKNYSQSGYQEDPEAAKAFWGKDNVGESEKKRYVIVKQIAEGAEGAAYEAIDRETGTLVAIKKVSGLFKRGSLFAAKQVLAEVRGLAITRSSPDFMSLNRMLLPRHPHSFDTIYIVLDMLETPAPMADALAAGDIRDPAAADTLRLRVFQFVRGVAFLHSVGLVHADLRYHNVMIDEICNLRIIDLGDLVPAEDHHSSQIHHHFPGTGDHHRFSRDLWMMGTTILTWVGGKGMYLEKSNSIPDKARLIAEVLGVPTKAALGKYSHDIQRGFQRAQERFDKVGQPPTLEQRFPTVDPRLFELVRRVMRFDRKVPSATELLKDPYFEGLHKRLPVPQGPRSAVRQLSSIWRQCTSVSKAREMICEEVLKNRYGVHKP